MRKNIVYGMHDYDGGNNYILVRSLLIINRNSTVYSVKIEKKNRDKGNSFRLAEMDLKIKMNSKNAMNQDPTAFETKGWNFCNP